jgi:hypothetical protein
MAIDNATISDVRATAIAVLSAQAANSAPERRV